LGETDILGLTEREHCHIRGREISIVFQDSLSALNPMKRIGWQIEWVIQRRHSDLSNDPYKEATQILEKLGIEDAETVLRKYPHQLSGGQRQRVLIAMAVAARPKLIIADEPTTSVDTVVQRDVLDTLLDAVDAVGASLILITHDLAIVSQYCDRIAVMYAGRIVESGTVEEVLKKPKHPYTEALLRSHVSLPRFMRDPELELPVIPGMMPTLDSLPDGCAFWPRCSYATEQCKSDPGETKYADSVVECWHPLSSSK